jgi:hypothetical protein
VATANGFAIHEAEIDVPFRRIWLASLTFTDDQCPVEGEPVELVVGPWSALGTCIESGVHGGVATARVVAGAGGWRRAPTGLAFQNDANLSRADIAQALASSVGEEVEADSDTIGAHWSFDPTISAGSNLDELGNWYVRDDGVTVIGTRADGAEFKAIVEHFDGKHGQADLLIEESDAASVLPGALISSDSLTDSIRVRHTRFLLSPNQLVAEVYTREQDPFRGARAEVQKRRFLGTYHYRIIEQIEDRLQLQAVDSIRGLPDQLLVDKAHGLPGVTTECAPSGEVLIVFADGNRALPFVLAYLGASVEEVHTTGTATFTTASPAPEPQAVARAPAVDTIQNALLAFCATIALAPSASAAALELQTVCATLAEALTPNIRTSSIVLEAQ